MSNLSPILFSPTGPSPIGIPLGGPIDPMGLTAGNPIQHQHNYFTDETGQVTAGVWTCTPMTTPLAPYEVNEFMLILEGSVTIINRNGDEDTIKAGEAFVIPKGMPCIWRQTEFVRKFYVIFEDNSGQVSSDPDSLKVTKVDSSSVRPVISAQDTSRYIGDTPKQHLLNVFMDVTNQMKVGLWDTTDMHTKSVVFPRNELMHLLSGSVTLNNNSGANHTFNKGDTFLVPKGMDYQWDSEGYVSKIYCIFEPEA